MKLHRYSLIAALLAAAGCAPAETPTDTGTATTPADAPATTIAQKDGDLAPAPAEPKAAALPADATPVPTTAKGDARQVVLSPANTRISFVGAHTDDKPDRVGGFEKFSGTLDIDREGHLLGMNVQIDATSLWTEYGNLTTHLSSPDFFDTREYPTAEFGKTRVTRYDDGKVAVSGTLTLHGASQEITFPGQLTVTDAGAVFTADFTIDRTKFGMDKLTEGVKPEVKVSVVVGLPTKPTKAAE
jgi:polyisoprenoid-binding protein YceI